jgi:hypothetical protein
MSAIRTLAATDRRHTLPVRSSMRPFTSAPPTTARAPHATWRLMSAIRTRAATHPRHPPPVRFPPVHPRRYDRAATTRGAGAGSARTSRTVVSSASATMSTALPTHQMQIAWIVNTSR